MTGTRAVVLAADPAALAVATRPAGVRVVAVRTPAQQAAADAVCAASFGAPGTPGRAPAPNPAHGGAVLAVRGAVPVAAAVWTAVVVGTSEIVSVSTVDAERRRGLGSLVTAAAAAGAARGGADLVWLRTSDAGAARVYRALGFSVVSGSG